MNVHILVTCRNHDLWRASTLVFDTIRVGFPDAKIIVTENGLEDDAQFNELNTRCRELVGEITLLYKRTVHHKWIEWLIETENEPFIICDTDVIFWDRIPVERFTGFDMAGRLIPRFYDEFTKCITHQRLHTSLLYIDPVAVRAKSEVYYAQFPPMPFDNMRPNLITGAVNPVRNESGFQNYFHDTCSMLYQVCGGNALAFDAPILDCFAHLNCGSYLDIVEKHSKELKWLRKHNERMMDKPELARGLWKKQDEYYAKHTR